MKRIGIDLCFFKQQRDYVVESRFGGSEIVLRAGPIPSRMEGEPIATERKVNYLDGGGGYCTRTVHCC